MIVAVIAASATVFIPTAEASDPNLGCASAGGVMACQTSYYSNSGGGCNGSGSRYAYDRVTVSAPGASAVVMLWDWCAGGFWQEHYHSAMTSSAAGTVGVYHLDSSGPYAFQCRTTVYAGAAGTHQLGCIKSPVNPNWGNLP